MPLLPDAASIPFSFRLDGVPSSELLPTWACERSSNTTVFRDPASGLAITVRSRRIGETALEWVLEITNTGTTDSPQVENILPLDWAAVYPAGETIFLHHANGSLCQMDDFLPKTTPLYPGGTMSLAPQGGRSSNGILPFFNLQGAHGGVMLAIGWSGQWQLCLERSEETLHLRAGMATTHLRLHSGETIRTPRILLIEWAGDDPEAGQNALRRLLMDHYLPRLNGELVMPPVAQCLQGYFYQTGQAGEQYEMTALPKVASLGATAYWIDACWYGGRGDWWQEVGSWTINRTKFPHGLRPISDAARAAGMQFVLWFEPERVRPGSLLHEEHSEFLLASPQNPDNFLYNLGDPTARAYITDLFSGIIESEGVDIYRQDFNFDPLPYWQAADTPDRIGMTEIRFIEGLYAFWDELRMRHPHLWIDNCSSGGRRIDLETMSRSLPLWPSDFPDICGLPHGRGMQVGDQCITAGLARWIPYMGGGVWNFTPYCTRGQLIGGFTFGYHIPESKMPTDARGAAPPPDHLRGNSTPILASGVMLLTDDFPMDAAAAAIAEWKSVRHCFTGDFHLLVPLTVHYQDWCAWQFHRSDIDAGIAVAFRRHQSPYPTCAVTLKGIDPTARYAVSISPGYVEAVRQCISGAELARLTLAIDDQPGSVLIRYSRE